MKIFHIRPNDQTTRRNLISYLQQFKDTEYTVTIDKPKVSRAQQNYYWGVIVETLCNDLGWEQDEMHSFLHNKFSQKIEKADPKTGEILTFNKSTTSLRTDEMEERNEKIRIWAVTELGIRIPLPNERN